MTTYQLDLLGNPTVAGDIVDRLRYILEHNPETRDDYRALIAQYWIQFDGLDRVLPDDLVAAFTAWIQNATSPKTIQNRALEIQRQQPELDAHPDVRRKRNRQATQGVVR